MLVVTLTGGERGDILNPAMDLPDMHGRMPRSVATRWPRPREILGVQQHWLGFVDSGLPEGRPVAAAARRLVRAGPAGDRHRSPGPVVREFRPHVMITYDEHGGYPHPDHIRDHEVSMAAYEAAADPEQFPDAGEPWSVSKLYYTHGFIRDRMILFSDEYAKIGQESPFAEWLATGIPSARPDGPGDHAGDLRRLLPQRDEALRAHATQIDPNGIFFAVPIEWQQRLWPTEEFELAKTRVKTAIPETDLFAGIDNG